MRLRTFGAVVLLLAGACTTWRGSPGALTRPDSTVEIRRARVVLRAGSSYEVRDASVRADSVIGLAGADRTRVAFARDEVARIETRQVSTSRTIGLVLGSAAVLALLSAIALAQALSEEFTAAPAAAPAVA